MSSTQFPANDSPEEERLAGDLSALADYRMPPSSVDVAAAIGAGRRRAHVRRGGTVLGTAAVLAITAVGAWGATAATHGGPAGVVSTNGPSSGGSDPMTPQLAFGWLPGPTTGGYGSDEGANGSNVTVQNGTVNVSATLERPGAAEPHGPYTDAGTVDGHPAVWAAQDDDSGTLTLVWRYKPDAWAYVLVEGASKTEVVKIADTLHVGPQAPVPLPMHLAALPHGFTAGGGSAMRNTTPGAKGAGGGFTLCGRGDCAENFLVVSGDFSVFHSVTSGVTPLPDSTRVLDLPSGVDVSAPSSPGQPVTVTVTIDGLDVTALATGSAVQAIGGESGLTAFVNSMTWYGTNPAQWTTNVIG